MNRFIKLKLLVVHLRHILLLLITYAYFQQNTCSQGTNIKRGKPQGAFFGISLEPSKSQIIYDEPMVSSINTGIGISFGGSFEAGYFFSNIFGLSSGVGFSSYETQLNMNSYLDKFNSIDSENESYERIVSGSDISELQKIGFLEIPFCINLRLPFNEKSGLFFKTGVSMFIPLMKDYQSSGTFTYSGYYAVDNVVLENLPEYDFPNDLQADTKGDLQLKQSGFNVLASAGVDFFVQKKIQIAVGGFYSRSLSSITDYSSEGDFHISTDAGYINSMMWMNEQVTTQKVGLIISVRYLLK